MRQGAACAHAAVTHTRSATTGRRRRPTRTLIASAAFSALPSCAMPIATLITTTAAMRIVSAHAWKPASTIAAPISTQMSALLICRARGGGGRKVRRRGEVGGARAANVGCGTTVAASLQIQAAVACRAGRACAAQKQRPRAGAVCARVTSPRPLSRSPAPAPRPGTHLVPHALEEAALLALRHLVGAVTRAAEEGLLLGDALAGRRHGVRKHGVHRLQAPPLDVLGAIRRVQVHRHGGLLGTGHATGGGEAAL